MADEKLPHSLWLMTAVLKQDRPDDVETIWRRIVGVSVSSSSRLYDLPPRSLASSPQDEWDRKMEENYEVGGALQKLVEKGRRDSRTGNTSQLP